MRRHEKRVKLAGTVLCELFAVFTIAMLFKKGELDRLAAAFGTMFLILLPLLLEKLLSCTISLPVYLFALAYSLGPLLGSCWKLWGLPLPACFCGWIKGDIL